MKPLDGAVVVHGGGPSPVLNASLAGIVEACRASRSIRRLYGARFGAPGLLERNWIELHSVAPDLLSRIRRAPGSVLGSSRKAFGPDETTLVFARFREEGIRAIFLTGGNGTMKTALLLHELAQAQGLDLSVIGIPKTVDNDIAITEHCPGFGSAARFYALAVRDIGADNRALPSPVTIIEIIGRNAGWVTGATALARSHPDDAPHLIYVPERPPELERICADILDVYRLHGRAVITVCEGLRDPSGNPFGADLDRAGNRQHELASNLGHSLARLVSTRTGLRVRSEKPGLLGRSCSFAVSEVDAVESYRCGQASIAAAESGASGLMIALRRVSNDPFQSETFTTPLRDVAGVERLLPASWINSSGNGVTADFLRYAAPLAGPIEALPAL
ncbi:MAG TPA: diphosphate--fructose-6-phosphate 1-phosphotransferase [Bryobacteraceae bacterium]|nr:diphosphate--fructose-6-phosphate 1-phosphotransferase [Bryobacteraceae bacterium]